MHNYVVSLLAKSTRNGDVEDRWRNIAEPVDGERRVVARNGVGSGPQTSLDDVLETLGREVSEAVNAMR